ncbi:type II secretion system protein N [Marinospirillum perlucidum]|uniref:type II secretion system protein N n=1 Tax=Marinospirillum perlucidum TaxID=1982602 RepID=UPI000DF33951|nr:type II secretion system protein N [Marinospirillum perlucidum]
MKVVQFILLRLAFVLLCAWIFVVTWIHQAPVPWLLEQAQRGWLASWVPPAQKNLVNQLSPQAFNGTLGAGEASQLSLAGLQLDSVQWQLSWWRLALFWPRLSVHLGDTPLPWVLEATAAPWGSQVTLQAGSLEVLRGEALPLALQGRLEGQLRFIPTLGGGVFACQKLEGQWQGRVRVASPLQVDLGEVRLEPGCPQSQQLTWTLAAVKQDAHELHLQGQAEAGRWSFTATAQSAQEAQLGSLLQLLQWRPTRTINQGELAPGQEYEARGSGRF